MDLTAAASSVSWGIACHTVKSSNSGIAAVRKSLNHPVIYAKSLGARLIHICGKKKFPSSCVLPGPPWFSEFRYLTEGTSRSSPQREVPAASISKKGRSLNDLLLKLRKFQNSDAHSHTRVFPARQPEKGTRDLQQRTKKTVTGVLALT